MTASTMNEIWRSAGESRWGGSKGESLVRPQELGVERSYLQDIALVRLRELDDLPISQREAPDIVELRANAAFME